MNDHTDPWETEMSREFDQRVRDLHEAPLTLDQVKGKAGRIRRTRRVAVAGGVLAAAAVIVPIVVFAGGNLTNDSGPEPAPKPTPHRHRPVRHRLRLPRGQHPAPRGRHHPRPA